MNHETFGQWLKDQRSRRNLTRQQLADALGIVYEYVGQIERGKRRPSVDLIHLIANFFTVSDDERAELLRMRNQTPTQSAAEDTNPFSSSRFVGREQEILDIIDKLKMPDCHLLTVNGAGGIGKSRLIARVARRIRDQFPDGVFTVELAETRTRQHIPHAIALALRLTLPPGANSEDQIAAYLRHRQLLLIFDHFDHLIEHATYISDLLRRAPGIKIIVTSRERLNIQEEWAVKLQGLSYPNIMSTRVNDDSAYDAVTLFIDQAIRTKPNFNVEDNRMAIWQICYLLQGLPLGILITASQVNIMTCTEIARSLEQGGILNVSVGDSVQSKHRSLRAVFDQSWNTLDERQRRALMHLSVFRGSFDYPAAEAVSGSGQLLSTLIDKSLIQRVSPNRFTMHDLLRRYLAMHPSSNQDIFKAHDAHLAYYLALSRTMRSELLGKQSRRVQQQIETEMGNIREAILWSQTNPERLTSGMLIAANLFFFWQVDNYEEGRQFLHTLLNKFPEAQNPQVRAYCLLAAGGLAWAYDRIDEATPLITEAVALYESQPYTNVARVYAGLYQCAIDAVNDRQEQAVARFDEIIYHVDGITNDLDRLSGLIFAVMVLFQWADTTGMRLYLRRVLALIEQVNSLFFTGNFHYMQGTIDLIDGMTESALRNLEAAVRYLEMSDEAVWLRFAKRRLGEALIRSGRIDEGFDYFGQIIRKWIELDDRRGIALACYDLAYGHQSKGDCPAALTMLKESLSRYVQLDDKAGILIAFSGMASAALQHGNIEAAARLCGVIDAHHLLSRRSTNQFYVARHIRPEQLLARFRAEMPPQQRVYYQHGKSLSVSSAVTYAMTLTCPPLSPS